MINQDDGKIGTREIIGLLFITISIKISNSTDSIFFRYGKNASWFLPIIALFVTGSIMLLLWYLIKKHGSIGLFELIFKIYGRFFGRIVALVFSILVLTLTVLNSSAYVEIVNSMYFPLTPSFVILLIGTFTSYFIANRGFEVIGRTASIVSPYLLVFLVLLIIFLFGDLTTDNIYPLFGPGISELINNGFLNSSVYIEGILLMLLIPYFRSYKQYKKASILGMGLGSLIIIIFFAISVMAFDHPAVELMSFPFHNLVRIAEVGTIQHIEAIYFGFWLIATTINFAFYLYIVAFMFARTFNINEFEPLILPFSGFVFFVALIPTNFIITVFEWNVLVLKITTFFIISMALSMWAIYKIKEAVN